MKFAPPILGYEGMSSKVLYPLDINLAEHVTVLVEASGSSYLGSYRRESEDTEVKAAMRGIMDQKNFIMVVFGSSSVSGRLGMRCWRRYSTSPDHEPFILCIERPRTYAVCARPPDKKSIIVLGNWPPNGYEAGLPTSNGYSGLRRYHMMLRIQIAGLLYLQT